MIGGTIGRPGTEEVPSYYAAYIGEVPDGALLNHLSRQREEMRALLSELDEKRANHRYAPGKWSVKEVLGHIVDSERIFGYRLLRIARGDATPLPGFDQDAYVPAGRFDRRPLRHLIAEYDALRASTIALLESLDEEALGHAGTANSAAISARAIAWVIAGHERHHVRVLRERYGIA